VSGDGEAPVQRRRRDAARTRRVLLEVAIKRFTRNGYASTTVREIADEAGVNVALINRYFGSKEGLFEACLAAAVTEINRDTDAVGLDDIAARMVRRLAGPANADGPDRDALLTLLRSSGEERVDEMRAAVLHAVSQKLAAAAGAPGDDAALLRAQVILSTALGIALLRSTLRLEPLASATESDLLAPLSDVINTLFPAATPPNGPNAPTPT
jgi:AcrR family transcriptional regulator